MIASAALAECFRFTQSTQKYIRLSKGPLTKACSPSVDRPFPAYGNLLREEAIMLLRRFYVQENQKGKFYDFLRTQY